MYILLCLYNNRREDMYSFQTFFFIKMGQSRPLFVYFRHFLDTISIIQIEKKRRWCAWDSNPGQQDGRRRRNHGAMAATIRSKLIFHTEFTMLIPI